MLPYCRTYCEYVLTILPVYAADAGSLLLQLGGRNKSFTETVHI